MKCLRKGYLFSLNATQKGKGFDLVAEPPRITLRRVPPFPHSFPPRWVHAMETGVIYNTYTGKATMFSRRRANESQGAPAPDNLESWQLQIPVLQTANWSATRQDYWYSTTSCSIYNIYFYSGGGTDVK